MTASPALIAHINRTTFNGGQLYRSTDGREVFVMSGCNDRLDIWQSTGIGERVRIGTMSADKFADMIGRPRVPAYCFRTRRWRDERGRFMKAPTTH